MTAYIHLVGHVLSLEHFSVFMVRYNDMCCEYINLILST